MKRLIPLLLLISTLTSCGGVQATTPTATQEAATTETNSALAASATPTPEEKDGPGSSLEGEDCLQGGDEEEVYEVESVHIEGGARVRVYTPPCYAEQPQRSYPVLYLLHGQTYNDDQWDRIGADEAADALIAAGDLPPFLIVMPYYPRYQQPADNPFAEAFIEEVLPWVEVNYRVIDDRASRAIGGLSMGGSWAIHFALTRPDLFGALGGHSPPVFPSEAGDVDDWLAAIPEAQLPRIWLDIGDRDQAAILASATWFEQMLTDMGIEHEWHLFAGRHEEAYWSEHVTEYLRWYAEGW
jgi:enterochelin esterase-like enzyme